MMFGIKQKSIFLTHTMCCCLLLQIYLLLMTAFVLQGHIFICGPMKHTEYIVDIKKWMSNFLLLNSEKTEVLIIGPKNHTGNNLEHCLTLDGCSLDSSSSVRNLGVIFDCNLSFDSHVSSICKTAFFLS